MKIKKIIPSIMTTLMSLSLITGATYSLFTSTSTHDITVSSGTVKVTSELKNLKLFSLTKDRTEDGTFANGGTATLNEGKSLTLGNITPGDKVTLDVVINNASTVNVKYRVRCFKKSGDDGLFTALKVESPATDWNRLNPGTEQQPSNDTKNISIELDEAVTDFQGKDVQIGILIEAVQGNVSNDIAHVNSLNGILAAKENADGKNLKVGDALEDIRTEGVTIDNLALADVGNEIVWDQVSDRFAILNNDTITYPSTFGDVTKSNLWKFVTNETYVDNSLYSQYLKDDAYEKTDLTLQAGLDVGNNDEKFTFNLNTTEANKYTIRSNHKESILNITAPNASVSHYGLLGESNVNSVAMNSYHEFGKTRLVSVVKGKVNVEPEAVVSVLAAKPATQKDVVIQKEENAIIKTAVKTNDVDIVTNEKLEVVTEDGVNKKVESAVNQETAAEENFDMLIEEEGKPDQKMSLIEFEKIVNDQHGEFDNATANLVRDVDLGGIEWDGIGGHTICYHGIFNGNFFKVSNFKPRANRRGAFFGRTGLDGGIGSDPVATPLETVYNKESHTVIDRQESEYDTVIKNLVLENVDCQQNKDIAGINDSYDAFAVLVGRAYNTKISNITINNATVQAHCKIGGIAGIAQNSIIENCVINNSKIMANYAENSNNIGGLVGYSADNVITNCVNNSEVYCSGSALCAGIVGFARGGRYTILDNVINRGTVISEKASAAGIMGGNEAHFYLNNVTNEGDVKVLGNALKPYTQIGGIGSHIDGKCIMKNVTNKGNIYTTIEPEKVGYIFGLGLTDFTYENVNNTGKYFLNNVETNISLIGSQPSFKL